MPLSRLCLNMLLAEIEFSLKYADLQYLKIFLAESIMQENLSLEYVLR